MKANLRWCFPFLAAFVLFLFLTTGCQSPFADDDDDPLPLPGGENPLLKARPGDWVSLRCESILIDAEKGEMTFFEEIRKQVTATDDKNVTLAAIATYSGTMFDNYPELLKSEEKSEVVALNSWEELLNLATAQGVKVETLEKENEAVKIGDKVFQTVREKYRVTFKNEEGKDGTVDMTYWVCPEIPLLGAVRVTLKVSGAANITSSVEVSDFGLGA